MLFADRRGCAICNGNGQSLLELLWLLKMNAFFSLYNICGYNCLGAVRLSLNSAERLLFLSVERLSPIELQRRS